MGYPLSPYTYVRIARSLSRPSQAQCERFFHYVATAQQWFMLLPADRGVPFTLFLNPHAGQELVREVGAATAVGVARGHSRYNRPVNSKHAAAWHREMFGYLDFASPVIHSPGLLRGADLGLTREAAYYVLDQQGRAAAIPPRFMEVATCQLNANIHPNAATLLETMVQRVAEPAPAGEPLAPITQDEELRAFAATYLHEEAGGFARPDDYEDWEARQLDAFQQLYAPRHAEQRARLRQALDGMLAWVYGQ